ncbi:hypothetical protein [Microtetraspora malaysiensis]|uniref:hypothetical protein n=1 Tax=Microtetraspora malaysiensis TaxID=161358 RepID=UPI003D91070D
MWGHHTRDEREQVTCLRELLDVSESEGVDSVFWTPFAHYDLPHHDDPERDLGMGSYGVVKVLDGRPGGTCPDMPWESKAAFTALADRYRG